MIKDTLSSNTIKYLDSIEEMFVTELSKSSAERTAKQAAARQSAEEALRQPRIEPSSVQPTERLIEEPLINWPTEQPKEQSIIWPVEQPREQPTEWPVEQPSEQPAEQPAEQEQSAKQTEAPIQAKSYTPSVWRELGGLGIKIAIICIATVLTFTFLYGFHRNVDPDMTPMVKSGDLVLFYRLGRDYAIGDLLLLDFQGERQVRRVVAREGDTVDITENGLVINGSIQQEPEIFEETWQYENGISFPITVGAGQVFVLGDAREGATDSRVYGPINVEDTLGTVITIIRRRNF